MPWWFEPSPVLPWRLKQLAYCFQKEIRLLGSEAMGRTKFFDGEIIRERPKPDRRGHIKDPLPRDVGSCRPDFFTTRWLHATDEMTNQFYFVLVNLCFEELWLWFLVH